MTSRDDDMRQTLRMSLRRLTPMTLIVSWIFLEDCVLEMPRGPDPWGARHEGKPAVRTALSSRFAGIPDVHYGNAEHITCGDTGVSKWTITGTTVDGMSIEVNGCDFYSFRGTKIAKKNSFWKIRT